MNQCSRGQAPLPDLFFMFVLCLFVAASYLPLLRNQRAVDMNGSHGAFGGGYDCKLGLWGDVAGGVDSDDACLLCVVYPHQAAFRIQTTAECFVKVGRELGAEIEEECVAFEW